MGQIQMKWYYTGLVEHYLRVAVRYQEVTVSGGTPAHWFVFTQHWVGKQSPNDKDFIRQVFAYRFRTTTDGLIAFECDEPVPLQVKRERLALLEKQFAIDAGLCGEELEKY